MLTYSFLGVMLCLHSLSSGHKLRLMKSIHNHDMKNNRARNLSILVLNASMSPSYYYSKGTDIDILMFVLIKMLNI